MQDLKGMDLKELQEVCKTSGFSAFKAKEIFLFIHRKLKTDLSGLTTLKLEEREKLKDAFYISDLSLRKLETGKGVKKASFRLEDGLEIETVLMDYGKGHLTICVSTQAGCPIRCLFCATGQMGFKRNLTSAEILSQVYHFAQKERVSNIVFMGMGEPFLNYENVLKAVKILNDESGVNIAARKIVFSTIGIISGIQNFANESKQLRLAWSLAAPFDEVRKELVPFKGLAPISETIAALNDYQKKTRRRITIEYVLLKGVNDSDEALKALDEISKKLDSHLNLIPYNSTPGAPFKSGNTQAAFLTLKKIDPKLNVTIRNSLGQEISAACGQLVSPS